MGFSKKKLDGKNKKIKKKIDRERKRKFLTSQGGLCDKTELLEFNEALPTYFWNLLINYYGGWTFYIFYFKTRNKFILVNVWKAKKHKGHKKFISICETEKNRQYSENNIFQVNCFL